MQRRSTDFCAPIDLPPDTVIFDFTREHLDEERVARARFGLGRYGERRPFAYDDKRYRTLAAPREYHMGIDLFAPAGSEVRSFADGEIFRFGYNAQILDYGYTLITRHELVLGGGFNDYVKPAVLFALHGHLSKHALEGKVTGQKIHAGDVIAWLGDRGENGGWVPHLHFQLSWVEPTGIDLPGVVSDEEFAIAQQIFPDPEPFFRFGDLLGSKLPGRRAPLCP